MQALYPGPAAAALNAPAVASDGQEQRLATPVQRDRSPFELPPTVAASAEQPSPTAPSTDGCDGHARSSGSAPLLVLSTTMGSPGDDDLKRKSTQNAIRGFMAQTPPDAVRPLVFTDSEEVAATVRAETEKVHPGVTVTSAEFDQVLGWPTLRSMMKKAEAEAVAVGAPFFGYANGDILFTEDLVVTLRLAREALEAEYIKDDDFGRGRRKGLLILGRRTNFEFASYASHLDHSKTCDLSRDLVHMAKEGNLVLPWSCDYFICTPVRTYIIYPLFSGDLPSIPLRLRKFPLLTDYIRRGPSTGMRFQSISSETLRLIKRSYQSAFRKVFTSSTRRIPFTHFTRVSILQSMEPCFSSIR